jgi:hypothetical protein
MSTIQAERLEHAYALLSHLNALDFNSVADLLNDNEVDRAAGQVRRDFEIRKEIQ